MGLTKVQDALDAWSNDLAIRIPFVKHQNSTAIHMLSSPFSYWANGDGAESIPAVGTYGSVNTPRVLDNTTTGALRFPNAPSGKTWSLANVGLGAGPGYPNTGSTKVVGSIMLVDRIADCLFSPNANTVNLSTFSATTRLASNEGSQLWVELVSGFTATAASFTFTYTNEGGSGSRTGDISTFITTNKATNSWNQVCWQLLNGTDQGIRSIEQVAFSGGNIGTGKLCLALVRPLAILPCTVNNAPFGSSYLEIDCVSQLSLCDKIYNASCLSFLGLNFNQIATQSETDGLVGEIRLVAN